MVVLQATPATEGSGKAGGKSSRDEELVKYVATCTVGKQRSSHASFYVTSSREVGVALNTLASVGPF